MRLPAGANQRCSSDWSPFNGPATGIFFPVEFLVSFLEVPTPDRTLTLSVCVAIGPLAKGYVILTMRLKRLVRSLTSVSLKETLGQFVAGLSSLSPNPSSPLPPYLLHTEPLQKAEGTLPGSCELVQTPVAFIQGPSGLLSPPFLPVTSFSLTLAPTLATAS